jgi:hypothetical protein
MPSGRTVYVAPRSNPQPRPSFGVAKSALYLGNEGGKLWRIDAETGEHDEIPFLANIAFE